MVYDGLWRESHIGLSKKSTTTPGWKWLENYKKTIRKTRGKKNSRIFFSLPGWSQVTRPEIVVFHVHRDLFANAGGFDLWYHLL